MASMAVRKFSTCFLHGSMGIWVTMYGSQKSHYPRLCHEDEEKIENDYGLRNDHRITNTQPISMILVSFFSEDSILSDEIRIWYIFEYQSNENRAFRFLGDARYNATYLMP